ncbi:phosphoribosylanthranilate isomerase [Companilactobacillus ginsenosidimutans]|uniref:N-(5'-phosphoribosyl)anthranilate isomerase n=1 Tax=Companilactobacillus ginsenosidimutans TaxID=1007676 RepID=A0A0H4QMQ5_9LACO|nr:phosphoribosylanthranilate isomerase [Companilactobacillus ginsenosidimutans]AKP68003.1 N-(5'-phosphoribosyl)anthranilate isomerase [Companilactobacillus ginsenosidimutans]
MTKIKICGLMTLDDIRAVNTAKPDLAGFIFAGGRHHLELDQALKMRQALDPAIPSVGVFVNAPINEMLKTYRSGAISMIQLHGSEEEGTVTTLQKNNIPIINVFKPNQLNPDTKADYIMLDSGTGNGKPVDWTKLQITTDKPLIIAGALDINNIKQAIKTTKPTIVDLSRGVETEGIKDPQKIIDIVKLVHSI